MTSKVETARETWERNKHIWGGQRHIKLAARTAFDPCYSPEPVSMTEMVLYAYDFTFERCGWRNDDGSRTEWINVLHDGKIIDAINVIDPA